ncbi:DUF2076 family protein [Herbaspirillum sp. 3R11]|uniref:DUF2076 family protein n=2 Tax=unclassified Herbaspirillum TaxID=2624150 RepID=UPI0032AF0536
MFNVAYYTGREQSIMSPQETQILQDFLNQLTQVRGVGKDAQADAMIAAAVAQQPDAAYLLVQRALLMDQALVTSKAQIASLQSQVQALQSGASPAPSFLNNNAWGNAPAASVRSDPPPAYAPAYAPAPVPAQAAPQYQTAPAPSPGFFGGGMGSMLGTVAATAAGVAGGAFLYQGIEHMMNNGSGSGSAHQNGLSAPVEKVENTTVNNYYGDNADKGHAQARDDSSSEAASGNDLADLSNIDLADSSDSGGYDDSMA